jgi:hypothetical protein
MERLKQMKKIVCMVACVGLILGFAFYLVYYYANIEESATTETTTSASAEPIASFDTVESFRLAMKKNPKQYIENRISIKGYMDKLTLGNYNYTWLEDVHTPSDELVDPKAPRIELFITDEVVLTVVGDGDYVEVCGTVEIEEGEVCLKNCTCTMITAFEEMK